MRKRQTDTIWTCGTAKKYLKRQANYTIMEVMHMATGTISNSNGRISLTPNTYFSLGCTMGAGEYPTSVTFPLEAADGKKPYWFNRDVQYPTPDTYTLYLSGPSGANKYTLGTVTIHNNQSDVTQKSFSVSCPNLRGSALYLSGDNTYLELRFGTNNTSMSVTIGTAAAYTACSAPTSVTLTQDGNGKLKVSWSGASGGVNNGISSYYVYLSTSSGGSAASGLTATVTSTATSGSYSFTVNNQTTYYAAVRTQGAAGASYYSGYAWSSGQAASYKTNCTAPTSVSLGRTRGTVTITWSGQSGGTNNPITSYTVLRNTSASESGATTVSSSGSSGMTNAPGAGTFYYGVRSVSSYNTTGYKWSGSIVVPSKPSVSAGTQITDTQMDNLRIWINTSGITDIADGASVRASEGNTYRNTLTAGSSKVEASWYNTAAG